MYCLKGCLVFALDCVITLPRQTEETCDLSAEDSGSPDCARR